MKRVSAQVNEKGVAAEADPIYQDSDFKKICVLPGALFCLDPLNRVSFFGQGPIKRYNFSLPLSLNRVRVQEAWRHTPIQNFQEYPPPPPPWEYGSL